MSQQMTNDQIMDLLSKMPEGEGFVLEAFIEFHEEKGEDALQFTADGGENFFDTPAEAIQHYLSECKWVK